MSKLEETRVPVWVWFLCWGVTWKPLQADDSSRYNVTSLAWIFPEDMQHQSSEDYPPTRKNKRQKKKNDLEGKGRAEASLQGLFMAQISFCKKVPSWKWYRRAEVLFFSLTMLLGSCKSWTESMKSGSLKKGTKPPKSGQKKKMTDTEQQDILLTFNCPKYHSFSSLSFFLIDLGVKEAHQLSSWSLSYKFCFHIMTIILVVYH